MIQPSSDTGDAGKTVSAYTAQFGGGLSATLSLEAPRTTTVFNAVAFGGAGAFITPGLATGALVQSAAATRYPDIVVNLRMDAPWGAAQVMGGIHDASGQYYGATSASGGPSEATGFFIGAGAQIFVPMAGPGDYFSFQVNYAQGATGYINDGATNGATGVANATAGGYYSQYNGGLGGNYGFALITDGVYGVLGGVAQNVQLTTAWGVNAAYEHFWTKRWQTSVYGTYTATNYNATANTMLCGSEGMILAGCNNNNTYWVVGSRTQFNVDSQTYVGLDVIYTAFTMPINGFAYTSGQGQAPVAAR